MYSFNYPKKHFVIIFQSFINNLKFLNISDILIFFKEKVKYSKISTFNIVMFIELKLFSRKSDSRIAIVLLGCGYIKSVCLSVIKTPLPLRIDPINHPAYQPSILSTIEPINHRAYQPSSLSTIEPIYH